MADTVLVNGIDLSTFLTPISLMSGFVSPPPAVGQDYQIPGRHGAIPTTLGRGPRVIGLGGLITGQPVIGHIPTNVSAARQAFMEKLIAFSNAIYQNGGTFNLTWRTGSLSYSTLARHQSGPETAEVAPYAARVTAEFLMLNPYWT